MQVSLNDSQQGLTGWFEFGPDGTLLPHHKQRKYPGVRNYLAVRLEKVGKITQWVDERQRETDAAPICQRTD